MSTFIFGEGVLSTIGDGGFSILIGVIIFIGSGDSAFGLGNFGGGLGEGDNDFVGEEKTGDGEAEKVVIGNSIFIG